jgi:hypothetical protein
MSKKDTDKILAQCKKNGKNYVTKSFNMSLENAEFIKEQDDLDFGKLMNLLLDKLRKGEL